MLVKNGRMHLAVLALFLSLGGCRTDKPPVIEVCILDGHGGGDCTEADHLPKYRLPSEMNDYWCTNQADEAAFVGWAYGVPAKTAAAGMELVRPAPSPSP